MDTLQKLAYDTDTDLACKSILALGLIGAGTNNSRLADMFRKLAGYYSKESQIVFCIRISQGLLYMGKVKNYLFRVCLLLIQSTAKNSFCQRLLWQASLSS